jgi:hypothetical protein
VKFNFNSPFGRDGKRVTHPGFRVIFHICCVLIYSNYSAKSAGSYSGRAAAHRLSSSEACAAQRRSRGPALEESHIERVVIILGRDISNARPGCSAMKAAELESSSLSLSISLMVL